MKERDLRGPVVNWFQEQGYECAFERAFPSGYCDILAFRFVPQTSRRIPDLLEVIAIELKLENVGMALYQAHGYWRSGACSLIAMPLERCMKMKKSTLRRFHNQHIGLLAIEEDEIEVWASSHYKKGIEGIQWMKQKLWRTHRKNRRQQ